jgi:hypothetical protein
VNTQVCGFPGNGIPRYWKSKALKTQVTEGPFLFGEKYGIIGENNFIFLYSHKTSLT